MAEASPQRTAAEALAEADRQLRAAFGERYVGCHLIKVAEEQGGDLGVVLRDRAAKRWDDVRTASGALYEVLLATGIHLHPVFAGDARYREPAPATEPAEFRAWCHGQADALRSWQLSRIDWSRLADVVDEAALGYVGETLAQRRSRAVRKAIAALRALRELGIQDAWLVGSLARGEFRERSDLDFLVDCDGELAHAAWRAIEDAVAGFDFDFIRKRHLEPEGLGWFMESALTLEQLQAREEDKHV